MYCRLTNLLDNRQSFDQFGFRPSLGFEHALIAFETVSEKCLEWGVDVWIASLDLQKVFDEIECDSLFEVLHTQNAPDEYIEVLAALCQNQTGTMEGNPPFSIQREVKQGHILSPALFNAGLEEMFSSWKRRLAAHGLDVGAQEHLTNVRYVDDHLVYAKSLPELVYMTRNLLWWGFN